jgi:hypothetical protein
VKRRGIFSGPSLGKRFRQHRLMRRYRPQSAWLNATVLVSLGALVVLALLGGLLERCGGAGDAHGLVAYARSAAVSPTALIAGGARTRGIVVLGDVPGSGAAKRTAAAAVDTLARGPGLDAVALEVDSTAQGYVDAFLESSPLDASILVAHPETLPGSDPQAYLEIYRRVWELNRRLGADRAILLIAAGIPDWPPRRALAPRQAAEVLARVGPAMARRIETAVLARNPQARVLAFADGYEALRSSSGQFVAGGGRPVSVTWLAALLETAHPGDVFSVLQDARPGGGASGSGTSYVGTSAYDYFRDARLAPPFALQLNDAFDFLRRPIHTSSSPGTELAIEPADYRLGEVADGFVYLGAH